MKLLLAIFNICPVWHGSSFHRLIALSGHEKRRRKRRHCLAHLESEFLIRIPSRRTRPSIELISDLSFPSDRSGTVQWSRRDRLRTYLTSASNLKYYIHTQNIIKQFPFKDKISCRHSNFTHRHLLELKCVAYPPPPPRRRIYPCWSLLVFLIVWCG